MNRYAALGGALCVLLDASGAQAQPKRPFTTSDIAAVRGIAGLEVAPDGGHAVYVERGISADGKRREQSMWLLDLKTAGPPTRLTTGAGDSRPKWSPDGSTLAFIRDGAATGVRGGQLVALSLLDKHERILTALDGGVSEFSWSPDGRSFVLTSQARIEGDPTVSLEPGVHVFTRANYRWSNAYVDFRNPAQLWVVGLDSGAPRRLTNGPQPATFVGWARDGRQVFYTVNETAEPYYGGGTSGLYSVAVDTAAAPQRRLALKEPSGKHDVAAAPQLTLSPDGRLAAFVTGAPGAPSEFARADAFVMDPATGAARDLTASLDQDIGGELAWLPDGQLLAIAQKQATGNLISIDVRTGTTTARTTGQQEVQSFSANGGKLLAVISTPDRPAEVYDVTTPGRQVQLTHVNTALTERTALSAPESIWFKSADGTRVQAFLQRPAGFDPAKSYPMIVWNHGGPHNAWTLAFNADVQAMAGDGYLVLYANPRGSSTYGQDFAKQLADKWPGGPDFDDLMTAVDIVSQRPYVDKAKLGIAGSSAGGVMTDWAITNTNRFAAAVSISDIADFEAMWFLGDQPHLGPTSVIPHTGQGRGDDNRRSPISLVRNVKTPTLFITGERDYRTPSPVGGEEMFRALKDLRIPTAMVRFDTAGHSISSSDYPLHSSLRTRYLLRWMDRELKGIPAPEFDVELTATTAPSKAAAPARP